VANRLSNTLLRYLPAGRARSRRGFGLIFAVFFYLYALVLAIRGPILWAMWENRIWGGRGESVFIGVTWVMLYAGSLLPSLVGGRRGGPTGYFRRVHANIAARIGFVILLVLVIMAILAPLLTVSDPVAQDSPASTRYQAPSVAHPLGTDKFGRDIYSRLLYGARVSLSIAVLSVIIAVVLGLAIGLVAGYSGGWVDNVLMRIVDGFLSFPRLLFVLTLLALFSNSYVLLILVISATGWMGVARLVRGETIRLKKQEFVQAAVATGLGRMRVVTRHVLPNSIGPVIVAATLNVGAVILLESYLSFLGLGVQPPWPSWGAMVFDGREMLLDAWWVSAYPAIVIVVAVVACNMIGDGLSDALEVSSESG
jgi:peptide/nickel transport system permease protein